MDFTIRSKKENARAELRFIEKKYPAIPTCPKQGKKLVIVGALVQTMQKGYFFSLWLINKESGGL